jgi:hypothetical protein
MLPDGTGPDGSDGDGRGRELFDEDAVGELAQEAESAAVPF